MAIRILWSILLWTVALTAANLPDWYARTLEDADFEARLVRDVAEIERIAGDRFEGDVVLVELRVRPLYGSRLALRRDEFMLRARNNNETSPAQTPDRIGGTAVLELGKERSTSSGLFKDSTNSGVWGGAPGTGTRPRRIPGPPDVGGVGLAGEERQTVEQRQRGEAPILDRLHAIELPLETADEPVSGYLFFEIPSKVKRKHLELSYDGSLGEFLIEFKRPE